MKLNKGEFETKSDSGIFCISIKQESDLSLDGGYTFEIVKNSFEMDRKTAKALLAELSEFID